ncbi:DUF6941 family protein [Achromobacter piechaudii]|uniref:DUF6941 family protein n=1 Tax=Achromobacter piechaudii TaxID=72556 RepID=UPI0015838190|nr:hypothetical protein [Achromobacter piechaudii]
MSGLPVALPISRSLSAMFADDFRQEVDGKITIVGMYQGRMIFPSFPASVAKLAVSMTVVTTTDRPFEKLIYKLYKDDEQIFEQAVSEEHFLKLKAEAAAHDPATSNQGVDASFFVILGPLSFEGPCTIRCRAETEEGEMGTRPLRVLCSSDAGAVEESVT